MQCCHNPLDDRTFTSGKKYRYHALLRLRYRHIDFNKIELNKSSREDHTNGVPENVNFSLLSIGFKLYRVDDYTLDNLDSVKTTHALIRNL